MGERSFPFCWKWFFAGVLVGFLLDRLTDRVEGDLGFLGSMVVLFLGAVSLFAFLSLSGGSVLGVVSQAVEGVLKLSALLGQSGSPF
ncbi:hypothetical protein Adeg_0774 [Ammonifex degensii KC4]|uniref:Uncharacterized protein n=1 Tax=Ammonifex degensii (strain DSM 10501 / KC4) TaxID=429009 RepID=C9RCE0_AMMDK|nr:hypothetical protein [Ammonifex degensii]ACX51917.1 hypothetical protein Adeg_0774 [Ammonifex degensii KC4]